MFRSVKKIIVIFTFVAINIESIFAYPAYQFIDQKNESLVKSDISEIYNTKQQYEDMVGYDVVETETEIYNANNDLYWWPTGSIETTTIDGKEFATGAPEATIITSGYGYRKNPFNASETKFHGGTDISGGRGEGQVNIIAAKDGIVVYPESLEGNNCPDNRYSPGVCTGYGNYVIIQHSDGNYTVYGHLSANTIRVVAGESVRQGQVIAKMGSSGSSTGPHVHFEVRVGSNYYSSAQDATSYVSASNPRPTVKENIVNGDSVKQTVCLSLKQAGYYDTAIAGIMKNMYRESTFIPNNLEEVYEIRYGHTDQSYTEAVDNGTYTNFVHDSAGYGLVQWTYYTLKQDLYDYAKSTNRSIGDLGMQIEFLLNELKRLSYIDNYLRSASHTAEEMTYYFCDEYENPAESCSTRMPGTSEYEKYAKNGCHD